MEQQDNIVYPPNNGVPKIPQVIDILVVLEALYINGMSLQTYIQQNTPITITTNNSYFPSGW